MSGPAKSLAAALAYAEKLRWPVFPIKPGDKTPLSSNGLKDATTEQGQIRDWWDKWPNANIGIPTGSVSGFDVLDVDPRHGGEESLKALEDDHGKLPDTVEQITGGGGRHILLKHHPGLRNAVDLRPGLDLRGEGGYVVVPPSVHSSSNRYVWEVSSRPGEVALAEWPSWLLAMINSGNGKMQLAAPVEGKITNGKRNALLASLAGSMRHRGMEQPEIEAALLVVNDRRCEPPLAEEEVKGIASSISNYQPSVSSVSESIEGSPDFEWPLPQPLPEGLPPVEPFDPRLLPERLRPWVEDVADRMQCPPDFPAVAAMVSLASVVGRQIAIRPKKHDDWTVVPNLWGGIVGRSGVLKTPALREPMNILEHLEATARVKHEGELIGYEADKVVAEARSKIAKADVEKTIKEAGTDPKSMEFARDLALKALGEAVEPPDRKRYVVNDTTVEKLGETLKGNPRGVLLFRDELTGFLKTLDKDGKEGDRAFYLEAWNGSGRYTYDRIGRGTIDIDAACVSLLGGIQPGPLADYVARAARGGADDDGLLQRFQMLVWPDISAHWKNRDIPPNGAARARAVSVYQRLDTLSAAAIGAQMGEGLPYLRFALDAQGLFDEWRTELEGVKLRKQDEHAMMESHLTKYRSLVPSLAVLTHLADVGSGPVGHAVLVQACAWAEYLESHVRRVYSPVLSPGCEAARVFTEHLLKGDLGTEFAARDVQRKNWRSIRAREEVQQGLDLLEDCGWIRAGSVKTAGRTGVRYFVSPRLGEVGESNG